MKIRLNADVSGIGKAFEEVTVDQEKGSELVCAGAVDEVLEYDPIPEDHPACLLQKQRKAKKKGK